MLRSRRRIKHARNGLAVFHNVCLHGVALLRRGFDNGHIAYARHGHMKRSGYRRCGKGKRVYILAHFLYLLLVTNAEALLLVYYKKAQVLKPHGFGQ